MSSFAPGSKRGRVEESVSYPPGAEFFPGKKSCVRRALGNYGQAACTGRFISAGNFF